MIIGKWNKSVILTYIGLIFSVCGMMLCITDKASINIVMSCLIIAGVCDMFDGFVARKCKRDEEEKDFGVQLDSLVDSISFIAFPIVIFLKSISNNVFTIIALILFAICGIARLAYFNIKVENNNEPVKFYTGLPVTYTALIFPILYLIKGLLDQNIFEIMIIANIFIVSIFNILKIKVPKPKGFAYAFFSMLAIGSLILYLGVL